MVVSLRMLRRQIALVSNGSTSLQVLVQSPDLVIASNSILDHTTLCSFTTSIYSVYVANELMENTE